MNKLYTLDNQVFQEPLPKGFDLANAVEIISPIKADGTVWKTHPDTQSLTAKDEVSGELYNYYKPDGTPDTVKEDLAATEEANAVKVAEAQEYLASTDFKMTADYDEDVTAILPLRQEARDLIRLLQVVE